MGQGRVVALGGPVRWEVHPHRRGARLVLTYVVPDLEDAPGRLAGWHVWLDVLAAVLDGASRSGHEPPHGEFKDGRFTPTVPGKGAWVRHAELVAAYGRQVAGREEEAG